MSKDINIADIVVHLYPENSCALQPHALLVAYNPEAVSSQEVLAEIRKCDANAMMAGF